MLSGLSVSLSFAVLLVFLISTAGGILQIGGASWDITSHILRKPETFFTPSHAVLYSGAGLTGIAAVVGLVVSFRRKNEIRTNTFYTAFKLLMMAAAIEIISGPSDFIWHSVYGVDGLMNPPHLALATGILIGSIATVVGIARLLPHIRYSRKYFTLGKIALVPAFAAFWFSAIWYIFMFVLPLSNGVHFMFNPNPAVAVVIATIALPLLSAMVFVISSRTIGKFGAASAVAGVVIAMNVLANIVPASEYLAAFIPWQLLVIIPAIVGAEIAIMKTVTVRPSVNPVIVGALIGVTFYIFNYPMLPMAFAELLNKPNASMSDILPSMYDTLPQVIATTAMPSALAGVVGAVIGSRKIRIPKMIDATISSQE